MVTEELLKSFKKSELFGPKNYGSEFDDIKTCCEKRALIPTDIIIRKGLIIDNLTFVYEGHRAVHGGMGGTEIKATLSQGDYIVKVSGKYGRHDNQDLIETLTFTTKNGNTISAGSPSSGKYDFNYSAEKDHRICALFGRAGYYLNSIGFYSFKIPEMQSTNIAGNLNFNTLGTNFG